MIRVKYARRIPQTDNELREWYLQNGWQTINEPSNLMFAIFLSMPFMVANAFLAYFTLHLANPEYAETVRDFLFGESWALTIRFDYILYVYLFVVFHEFLHLLFVPNFFKSDKTWIGVKPWGGFVFTTESLRKGRFLLISVAPFLILSIIVPFILGVAGLLNGFLIFLVLLNAFASSVDMLNAVLIAVQVPKRGTTVNNGFETYYKVET